VDPCISLGTFRRRECAESRRVLILNLPRCYEVDSELVLRRNLLAVNLIAQSAVRRDQSTVSGLRSSANHMATRDRVPPSVALTVAPDM
jgi:hypothetical protein